MNDLEINEAGSGGPGRNGPGWRQPPTLPNLPPNTIHVWRLLPAERPTPEECHASLPIAEQDRAHRFLFPRDQWQALATRFALRQLLAHYTGGAAQQIAIATRPQGKPYLPGASLHFNLSHTTQLALFAFAHDHELGVDVEQVRATEDLDDVAKGNFAPAEQAALASLDGAERTAAFYRCWTRKEALLKAEGSGLFRALDSFAVSLLPGDPVRLLTSGSLDSGAEPWNLMHLDVLPDAVGALAWRGAPSKPGPAAGGQQSPAAVALYDLSLLLLRSGERPG